MKTTTIALLVCFLSTPGPDEFDELVSRAEELYGQHSYALANRLYQDAAELSPEGDELRWVEFRLADTGWRSAAATNDPDTSELEESAAALQRLLEAVEREEDRDRIWAECQESYGDYFWERQHIQDWGNAWPHYRAALDFWAGSSDMELARRRYLDIVFAAAQPKWREQYWGRGLYGMYVPLETLQGAVEIAESADDRARAHFLLGSYYYNYGQNVAYRGRVEREFEAVLELGAATDWYDDSLYHLGNYLENSGRAERDSNDQWVWRQDYDGAVSLYRRILREFERGDTSYRDDARARIEEITAPALWTSVDQFFLPGSEISYQLGWRNLERVDLALYRVDLTRDVAFLGDSAPSAWLESIQLEALEPHLRWTHMTEDEGEHRPGQAELVLDEKLRAGAWVLTSEGRGKEARALILVSDATLTAKATDEKVLAWYTDVGTGAPLPDAQLRLWQRFYANGSYRWRERRATTADDGTFLFDLGRTESHSEYFLAASAGERQAFAQDSTNASRSAEDSWRIYAQTDRPAYRPGNEVQWKFTARRWDGSIYSTPAGEALSFELLDPLGAVVEKGDAPLNAFGTAWSSCATNETMALGEYRVQFYAQHNGGRSFVGNATLFRLEEYKRPEFEVTVQVPEVEDGSGGPKLFQVGERVEFEVDASYYFGGPVVDANVEVFVYQKPYYHSWSKEREFPWFYEDGSRGWWGGHGQQVAHQLLKTDLTGRATVAFDTEADAGYDLEYTIEARVTDSSRREILGSGAVRVTRTEYFVNVEAEHAIHRPGAKVELELTSVDPNGNPVPAQGQVRVTRARWLDVKSSRQHEDELIETASLRTGEDGRASWEFTPDADGTYRVAWTGVDARGHDILGETTVFVADESTRELGYLPGGIEILIDKDTVEAGEDALVLLTAPASGRWVLFTVEGTDLYQHEVFELTGAVKLVRLPIDELHVPNVYLGAVSIADGEAFQDRVELIVPPVAQFLDVEVTQSSDTYLPGDEGSLSVRVTDHDGRPALVELALGVVDDSLAYIQGDYAGDPRRFFYGEKRGLAVRTQGTVHHGGYRKLVRGKDGTVEDQSHADGKGGGTPRGDGMRQKKESRMAARAPMERAQEDNLIDAEGFAAGAAPMSSGEAGASSVKVRSDFRETALWMPDLVTDENGEATVTIPFPDSTTRWRTTVRAVDTGARFGTEEAIARTRQPLIARLQAPRFFLAGDRLILSGNLNNNTDAVLRAQVTLEAKGLELIGRMVAGRVMADAPDTVEIPAQGELRLDWSVRVVDPGQAQLLLTARSEELSDAVERRLPIYPHGIDALEARSGKLDAGEIAFTVELPAERDEATTRFTVQVTPSMAVTMLDALPYLVNYPYGCTEQTLSRFLPSVIVAGTLRDLGLSAEDAMLRAFGGIEEEFVDETHPGGKQPLERLDQMVDQGLTRLYDFQHADGGWAWWKTGDSDRFMTAYVLWGLSLARDADVPVRPGVLENAARWLTRELVEEERASDAQAWMLHALAVCGGSTGDEHSQQLLKKAYEGLWNQRDSLNAYGSALLALAAHEFGYADQARILADNVANGVDVDESPDTSIVRVSGQDTAPFVMKTAHWGNDGIQGRWSNGGIEATAFGLRALLAIDPENELVEPVMNWLVKNRRGAQWSNTRDTAITVLALNDYLRVSGELATDVAYDVTVNGRKVAGEVLTQDQLLRAPGTYEIDPEWLRDGQNVVQIRKTEGDGPLYFAAYARFFSREDPIPPRSNELFARREYHRLVGRKTLLKGYVFDRVLLEDGDSVRSGERIEVIVTIEAKNNLEYLLFEDLKPAGFEAVEVKSGEPMLARQLKRAAVVGRFASTEGGRRGRGRTSNDLRMDEEAYTGQTRAVHRELRDRKVAMFVDELADGTWELRYDLRAEVPGRFHALPLLGQAMYVPEIRCNGQELRLEVLDATAE